MKLRALLFVVTLTLSAPVTGWSQVSVVRADCLALAAPGGGFDIPARYDNQGSLAVTPTCAKPGISDPAVSVYTAAEINSFVNQIDQKMTDLKTSLQQVLEDAVFKAAVQNDQIALLQDEVWKRVQVKYRSEIESLNASLEDLRKKNDELRKSTEELQAKIQTPQPAPAAVQQ
jgi:predicted ribosome quality control (RQC) complex YloA/Tae2 family protein